MSIFYKLFIFSFLIMTISCSKNIVVKDVDYGWALEKVIKVSKDTKKVKRPDLFKFDPIYFFQAEDVLLGSNNSLRIIRDREGFYFVTSNMFKNVYVLAWAEGGLELINKIDLGVENLEKPFFNQKGDYIILVNKNREFKLNRLGVLSD
ncbi:MAG: hypothetical protein CR982_04500 [Candidatus Cloacimonadota bacterium]|nr:MAG: hypothetical protein CR982_04500 [Candidatus Cloacimonadota bacterium]PIE80063.1 MAG: hypothetical protein CSA15_02260 [Candidatus Delongbacteria bacterium]